MEQTEKKNRPVHESKVGLCRVTLWANQRKDGNGERLSATVSRLYPVKSEDGSRNWKQTSSFSALDIPHLQAALTQAFAYMTSARVSDQPESADDEADRVASI